MSKKKMPVFIVKDKNGGEHVKSALLAEYVRGNLDFILVRNSGKQDVQIYVYENGVYRYYAPEMFKGRIKEYIAGYDKSLVTMNTVNEVFNQLSTDLNFVSIDELNTDEGIINFGNGILKVDAENAVLLPHSSEYLSTVQIPCEWKDELVETPVFDRYLDDLASGDGEIKRLLLQFIGVVISNVKGYRLKKALFLYGPGDTGKSQLKSLCERLIGNDNFCSADFNEFEERFGTSALYGKRLTGSSDASYMSVKELKTFKKLTGGDSIHAEFKGQKAFDFTYNGLIWLCMNALPKFGGDNGEWVYRRIMPVECRNVIPAEKQDKELLDRMYAERCGIVQKAVIALQSVIAAGYHFDVPESVIRARDQYKKDNESVECFFEECVIRRPERKVNDCCTAGRMYDVYRGWCRKNTHGFAKTEKEFREDMTRLLGGICYKDVVTHIQGKTYYRDISLNLDAKSDYVWSYGFDTAVGPE